jgi:hypothetical protein
LEPRHALWATAAIVMIAAALSQGHALMRGAATESGFPVMAALSNQSWSAWLSLGELKRNLPAPILGWTKDEHFPSTSRSLDELDNQSVERFKFQVEHSLPNGRE